MSRITPYWGKMTGNADLALSVEMVSTFYLESTPGGSFVSGLGG